jgi:uroporphyrinogen decarboxylase
MSTTRPAGAKGKLLLRTLAGEIPERVPFWLMRQAGRYLPEYRALRARAGGFMDLCLTPELAVEVTLQPVRRFATDGAILFSDILVVPYGLGQAVDFIEERGPVLEPLERPEDLARLSSARLTSRLDPIYQAVGELARSLPAETALIGFAGAPWTVASYMIEGGTSRDFTKVKAWAYGAPESFARLMALISEATLIHLSAQIEAGAELVQIFDSWAGALPADMVETWSLAPLKAIVAALKARYPRCPVILFPRGVGAAYARFARHSGAAALSLDTGVPLNFAKAELQPYTVLQGNLDPAWLLIGGRRLCHAADEIVDTLGPARLVFNLGHGVMPQTPPENVALLADHLRRGQALAGASRA